MNVIMELGAVLYQENYGIEHPMIFETKDVTKPHQTSPKLFSDREGTMEWNIQ